MRHGDGVGSCVGFVLGAVTDRLVFVEFRFWYYVAEAREIDRATNERGMGTTEVARELTNKSGQGYRAERPSGRHRLRCTAGR